MRNIVIGIVLLFVMALVGCRSMLDEIGSIVSVADAVRVRDEIIIKHRKTQIDLKRIAEDDKIAYKDALGFIDQAIAESYALQDIVIGSPDNPISILGMLAPLGIGAYVGKEAFKRRKDYSPEEVEAIVAKAKQEALENKGEK